MGKFDNLKIKKVFIGLSAHSHIPQSAILISFLFFVFFFFSPLLWRGAGAAVFAQEGTRISKNNSPIAVGKILLIPFEPKLYMSDIDKKINQQTKWNFEQIRENFRHQLDAQLKLKLQSTAPVISFYSDSVKMWKDLLNIYKCTSLSYDLDANENVHPTPSVGQNGIKNGQLAVEINTDKKFMNLKLNDTKLLGDLNRKYKTEYFVFINQLDIKNEIDSYDIATDTYQREITVHYSIFDKTGKNISAGTALSGFTSKENDPKKIVSTHFSSIATNIAAKFTAIVKPEPANKTHVTSPKGVK